jgi:type I restriction enzyme S subunit
VARELVRDIRFPVSRLNEQRAIADYLDRETAKIDQLIATVEPAIERLQEYRSALITAAVTGKIDVRGFAPTAAPPESQTITGAHRQNIPNTV